MENAIDLLLDLGVTIISSVGMKVDKENARDIITRTNHVGFRLIKAKRYAAADWILSGLLERVSRGTFTDLRKMIVVNLANAIRRAGDVERSESILCEEDWDSSAEKFKISIAALRGDMPMVLEKLEVVHLTKEIGFGDLLEWPVFDDLRADKSFSAAVERLYGQKFAEIEKQIAGEPTQMALPTTG
jgi:hypothetical protein